ncbi:MAG: transglycosylase SLT domain-containing protein [Paludibacteraceae bacterium]|jgi:membrane-bound lytic murein transglycosylase D|nr:transglycosylase SLT domain-containing protein [Paludibacteraceae bacterium]
MRRLLFILFIPICSLLVAQEMVAVDTTTTFFDEALAWIDTTDCQSDTLITELPDSVYKIRLQALPLVVEVPYNEVVRRYILRYVKHSPRQLAALQRKSEYYFPIFEDIIARHQLPYELCYLSIVESALNPQARSHMGAAGLWQFMPATGKRYGLEVNSLVDERMDPIRATEAACRYLSDLYGIFNDWNLAIAAYNCGPGNVNKAIHRAGGKRDFWSIYPFLPKETRGYLPIFIAVVYAMNYAEMHGICPSEPLLTMASDTIVTNQRQHLKQIAENLDIPLSELRRLNPQYPRDIIPGNKDYAICLPIEKAGAYIDNEHAILAYQADELINNRRAEIELLQRTSVYGGYSINGITYYKIKEGDTLGGIAQKFHVSVKQLKAWNGLKSDAIRAGKTLKIGS